MGGGGPKGVPGPGSTIPVVTSETTDAQEVKDKVEPSTTQDATKTETQTKEPPLTAAEAKSRVAYHQLDGQLRQGQLNLKVKTTASISGKEIAQLATAGGKPVHVAKDLGPPDGFKTRYEALAFARGANSDNAAIFQDENGKWRAVVTDVPLGHGNPTWSPDATVNHLEFINKPDLAKWKDLQKQIQDLKTNGAKISDYELQATYRDLVATALGVPPTEINIIQKPEDADPKKINFNPFLNAHGNAGAAALDDKPGAIQIGRDELSFDNPFEVITTVFHEATHVRHHDESNKLHAQWQEIKGKKPDFSAWLEAQHKKNKISLEQMVMAESASRNDPSPSEAISYVNGFTATFAIDRKDDRLIFSALGQAAKFSPENADLKKELIGRLEAFYKTLDAFDQDRFKAAMTKAKNDYPNSWLVAFKYS